MPGLVSEAGHGDIYFVTSRARDLALILVSSPDLGSSSKSNQRSRSGKDVHDARVPHFHIHQKTVGCWQCLTPPAGPGVVSGCVSWPAHRTCQAAWQLSALTTAARSVMNLRCSSSASVPMCFGTNVPPIQTRHIAEMRHVCPSN